ncbi:MAG: ABC transporter permease [Xanthobacteraceae bacterium]|nr:ABC transporter permease [Xanthobacteraceae bacterium]
MIRDICEVAKRWRLVHLLGVSGLRARYARSILGQFWLMISNLIFVVALGLLWSQIWKMQIDEYLPFIACGSIIYQFIASTINESPAVLVGDARIYVNERVPFLLSTMAHLYRQVIIVAHNVPIMIGIILWSKSAHLAVSPAFIFSLVATLIFLAAVSYSLSLVCARYRDLIQLVATVMQVMFLLTPVMWQVSFLPAMYVDYLFVLNPFASLIDILRNPLIGMEVHRLAYFSVLGWTLASVALAALAHRVWARTVIFWL